MTIVNFSIGVSDKTEKGCHWLVHDGDGKLVKDGYAPTYESAHAAAEFTVKQALEALKKKKN